MKSSKTKCIGILTSGGDCPGLNAAIRGIAKTAFHEYGIKVVGIKDGFRGLVENRSVLLTDASVSGILTLGGTVLGTSRDKPRKMRMGSKKMDLTDVAVNNARGMEIDCLVCLGGGGTQKNALHLHNAGGLNVITLPKTIDNDVGKTDTTFGFDTAMQTATSAIDALHTTATSHQRIIICEVMGHNTGWLALGAGLAGGADIICIPELPYDCAAITGFIKERRRNGKRFSIIALAEGARSSDEVERETAAAKEIPLEKAPRRVSSRREAITVDTPLAFPQESRASRLARKLEDMTGIEARVTSLGHVLRGGIPSAADRLLCTLLGAKAAQLCAEGRYNVMVAIQGNACVPVPLEEVAGIRKCVPLDHPWIQAARRTGTCMGKEEGGE